MICQKKRGFVKTIKHFSKIIFIIFQSIPNTLYIFCHFRGSFCFPSAKHEVHPLQMYRFTAEIKAARTHVCFQRAFFQLWKQIKVARVWGGTVLAVQRVGLKLPLEGVDNIYFRSGSIKGALSCRKTTFWASWGAIFSVFLFHFF